MSTTCSWDLGPPFIPIPNLHNLRDVGGYALPNSCTVRKHVIYRASDPTQLDEPTLKRLHNELNITHFFDLRSKPEIDRGKRPVDEVDQVCREAGIQRVWAPVFKEDDYSPERLAVRYKQYADTSGTGSEGFTHAYLDILSNAGPAYSTIFRYIASLPPPYDSGQEKTPAILFHCSAGKDRAGMFAAMLLGLLGVEDDTVATEYNLTEKGLAGIKHVFVQRLLENPAFADVPDKELKVENMVSARKESMVSTLNEVKERYGGPQGYVKQVCGLSDDEIAKVREVMTAQAHMNAHGVGRMEAAAL